MRATCPPGASSRFQGTVMRLGTRARYGMRMMAEMARLFDGSTPLQLHEISETTGISRRYLEQIAIPLKRAALIEGRSGRNGGYLLTRSASRIRLREIIEAVSGPIELVRCVQVPETCPRNARCHCRRLWTFITDDIRTVLDNYSLANLVEPEWMRANLSRAPRRTRGGRKALARQSSKRKEEP
jgi:Rrf2 family transcriptional regulator, cysteine metabolism repressor